MTLFSGFVRDKFEIPLARISITVVDQSGDPAALSIGDVSITNPVTSDQFGAFSFEIADGTYRLEFRQAGKLIRVDEEIIGSASINIFDGGFDGLDDGDIFNGGFDG